jgi:hypothetical protein
MSILSKAKNKIVKLVSDVKDAVVRGFSAAKEFLKGLVSSTAPKVEPKEVSKEEGDKIIEDSIKEVNDYVDRETVKSLIEKKENPKCIEGAILKIEDDVKFWEKLQSEFKFDEDQMIKIDWRIGELNRFKRDLEEKTAS